MPSLEASHDKKRVEQDRTHAIEACVVRVMKARKTLEHTLLVAEVLSQLHFFKPKVKAIKNRIEHLIERDYLKRNENNAKFYDYLA